MSDASLNPSARPSIRSVRWFPLLAALAIVLVLKVTASVVAGYRDYFPPDFTADFLLGREGHFFGPYRWAFYTHLVAGPAALLLGTLLVVDRFRQRFPRWHRRLGRVQAMNVLLLVVPSGLWMSFYTATGAAASVGLGALAVVTAVCVAMGWRTAVMRRFAEHQVWMQRTYVLLCSAVVIRMMGGLAEVTQFDADWVYPASAWLSWLLPLAVYEVSRRHPADDILVKHAPS